MNRLLILHGAALAATLLCSPAEAAPQAYVESAGRDANTAFGCSRIRTCRTFRAAMSVVDAGGEIVALDAAEYGSVAVIKSVTIVGNAHALVAPPSGDAIVIPTVGVDVVLRGITLKGSGLGTGIHMSKGNSLTVQDCEVSNFGDGMRIEAAANVHVVDSVFVGNSTGASIRSGASASVSRSHFIGNRGPGLIVFGSVATTSASVSDSVASGNLDGFMSTSADPAVLSRLSVIRSVASNNRQFGFAVSSVGVITVGDSLAAGNGTGFANVPGIPSLGPPGIFETLGNNIVRQNTTATSGAITSVPGT